MNLEYVSRFLFLFKVFTARRWIHGLHQFFFSLNISCENEYLWNEHFIFDILYLKFVSSCFEASPWSLFCFGHVVPVQTGSSYFHLITSLKLFTSFLLVNYTFLELITPPRFLFSLWFLIAYLIHTHIVPFIVLIVGFFLSGARLFHSSEEIITQSKTDCDFLSVHIFTTTHPLLSSCLLLFQFYEGH